MSKLIIGNQKMSMNRDDITKFIDGIKKVDLETVDVIICPSYPYLDSYRDVVSVGAQNVSMYDNGAHTGDVSAEQLQSLEIPFCIVGHSERRREYHETNEDINTKIKKLLDRNITPILCIGEDEQQRDEELTESVIKNELDKDLKDLSPESVEKIIIAYEPIWAIGTGLTPTNLEIEQATNLIKRHLKSNFEVYHPCVLYGGSVSEKNVDTLNTITSIDGYLIGGSSTKIESFKYIIDSQK